MVSSWQRVLCAAGVLLLGALGLTLLVKLLRKGAVYGKFLILCRRSKNRARPRQAIQSSCHAALQLLKLKKFPRSHNEELLEYAETLPAEVSKECKLLFTLFYRSEYRSEAPSPEEAAQCASCLAKLRTLLRQKCHK